ncbi:MAG TPA: AmmeMemoRadiSam system protein A [Candidatus Aquilonibacter sp.]|nr:AmmeMemoRadiSam system protein A [Candidatus Aquilonibacter sp.]
MSLPPSDSPGAAGSTQSGASSGEATPTAAGEFSPQERAILLDLAHESILSVLEERTISLKIPTRHLAEPRGVFTSLHLAGQLRGCVGYVLPTCALYRAVAETARAAAFDDSRFPPVIKEEAPQLDVELSILSRPEPIRAEEVEIGRHGLLVSFHGRRGLLLPQVPIEHGWNRETFLDQTCRKAGLPDDAWRKGAALEAFTAEVFGDKGKMG